MTNPPFPIPAIPRPGFPALAYARRTFDTCAARPAYVYTRAAPARGLAAWSVCLSLRGRFRCSTGRPVRAHLGVELTFPVAFAGWGRRQARGGLVRVVISRNVNVAVLSTD